MRKISTAAFRHSEFEHAGDIARRAVAEELSESFFVEGNAMLLDQSNKVGRCVAGQRRFREVWVRRDEIIRLAMNVGEIAASSARNKNFLARTVGAFDDRYSPSASSCLRRAHESRSSGPEDQDIKFVDHPDILRLSLETSNRSSDR